MRLAAEYQLYTKRFNEYLRSMIRQIFYLAISFLKKTFSITGAIQTLSKELDSNMKVPALCLPGIIGSLLCASFIIRFKLKRTSFVK